MAHNPITPFTTYWLVDNRDSSKISLTIYALLAPHVQEDLSHFYNTLSPLHASTRHVLLVVKLKNEEDIFMCLSSAGLFYQCS